MIFNWLRNNALNLNNNSFLIIINIFLFSLFVSCTSPKKVVSISKVSNYDNKPINNNNNATITNTTNPTASITTNSANNNTLQSLPQNQSNNYLSNNNGSNINTIQSSSNYSPNNENNNNIQNISQQQIENNINHPNNYDPYSQKQSNSPYNQQQDNNPYNRYKDYNYNGGYNDQQYYENDNTIQPYRQDQYNSNITYNNFYEDLEPYGQWIQDNYYGYAWVPFTNADFKPYYTNGHWAMTDYGNTWISHYPWGWCCFHYGRWMFDSYYGWLWIPGQEWGPAWVFWRYGNGYYAWAPLSPDYNYEPYYNCPQDWWTIVQQDNFYSLSNTQNNYVTVNNYTVMNNTTVVNNTYVTNNVTYISGPKQEQIEQSTHKKIEVYKINNSSTPNTSISDNIIKMYKPQTVVRGSLPAPQHVLVAPSPINAKPQAISSQKSVPNTFVKDVVDNKVMGANPTNNLKNIQNIKLGNQKNTIVSPNKPDNRGTINNNQLNNQNGIIHNVKIDTVDKKNIQQQNKTKVLNVNEQEIERENAIRTRKRLDSLNLIMQKEKEQVKLQSGNLIKSNNENNQLPNQNGIKHNTNMDTINKGKIDLPNKTNTVFNNEVEIGKQKAIQNQKTIDSLKSIQDKTKKQMKYKVVTDSKENKK